MENLLPAERHKRILEILREEFTVRSSHLSELLGVSEMTRFGMQEDAFLALAELIKEVVQNNASIKDQVMALREPFCELQFCFRGEEYADILQKLHGLL